MKPLVVLRRDAEDDIESISDYIAADSLDSARRFRNAIRSECEALAEMLAISSGSFAAGASNGLPQCPIIALPGVMLFMRKISGITQRKAIPRT